MKVSLGPVSSLNLALCDEIMTVAFYAWLICEDIYTLVVAKFEVLGCAITDLRVVRENERNHWLEKKG